MNEKQKLALLETVRVKLDGFAKLERRNTDEVGWIMLGLGVSRRKAASLIAAARADSSVKPTASSSCVGQVKAAQSGAQVIARTIRLPAFGLVIEVNGQGSGRIVQSEIGNDAIESLILAHACAGVDVTAPAYVGGVKTAIEAVGNHS